MEYKGVDAAVYGRYAITPPVINSDMALQFGIDAVTKFELREGSNVKLRFILENHTKRMTCHATVDWVHQDDRTGENRVGLGSLSLSNDEFAVLERNVIEYPTALEFRESVRGPSWDATTTPITTGADSGEITRLKAVTLPVSLIEAIDAGRGDVSFSQFVAQAVRSYLER